jgi:3'(2'),5'-bisphosphate nucleotidase
MNTGDLQRLCQAARAAGEAVLALYHSGARISEKADRSPVTEADLQADRIIREHLGRHFPTIGIVSEESAPAVAPDADTLFLVDPLDGTREFIDRNGEFTINIALVTRGRAIAGVVYAPVPGLMYFAAEGAGAWRDDGHRLTRLSVASRADDAPLRIVGSRNHATADMTRWLDQLAAPHEFVAVGSSLKFCRLAEGGADLYPRFGPTSQWDTAAGQCVLEQAGGQVTDWSGKALDYGLHRDLINPAFLASGASASLPATGRHQVLSNSH